MYTNWGQSNYYKFIYWLFYLQFFVLLTRFFRRQLQSVIFSLSYSLLKSLTKISSLYITLH
ncbi:hypothetical protein RJB92_08680 [Staphylococcus hominis]|nr:hypothetical protein [Staphylococcus hominis]MDS3868242.1 hypothetical protein [Staphylococcus hominis]